MHFRIEEAESNSGSQSTENSGGGEQNDVASVHGVQLQSADLDAGNGQGQRIIAREELAQG